MFSKAAFCISMSISLTSQVSYLNVFLAPPERKTRRSKQSLCSNRSLTNSVNKKPQRRKLASSSKDHIVIHKCVSISPSPQPDRNSQFWHCHSFPLSLCTVCPSLLPFHLKAGGSGGETEVIACDTPRREKKGGGNRITSQSWMPQEQKEM